MISIVWDKTLPPVPDLTPEEAEIKRWDEWFALTGLGEEWAKIKQACADTNQSHNEVIGWARIIEITRIGGIV